MTKFEDNQSPYITFLESAAPSTPASTFGKLYEKTDGKLYFKNDAGTEKDLSAPPGTELDYVQITSPVTITGVGEGSANTIVTGTSQAYAAVPTIIEVYTPYLLDQGSGFLIVTLWDGASPIGRLLRHEGATGDYSGGNTLQYRLTPTAATHQYIVKGQVDAGQSEWGAGVGGATGVYMPSFIRVTKV